MAQFGFHSTGDEVVKQFEKQARNRTILITGASENGLGAETALSIARANPAQLILLARSAQKVQPVIDQIKTISLHTKTTFCPVELDKLSSVKIAAQQIKEIAPKIDILINNAGIMAVPYRKNDAGIESHLATNHLGHFALTSMLMPAITAAGEGSRIVNVTSDGYEICPFRFEDWNFSDGQTYDEWSGYGQSKTANILFTRYLAKVIPPEEISTFAVHPGVIMTTSLSNHLEDRSIFDKINDVANKNTGQDFQVGKPKTAQEGVATTLVAALDPSLKHESGALLMDCNVVPIREYASSEANAERLWKLSEELTGMTLAL